MANQGIIRPAKIQVAHTDEADQQVSLEHRLAAADHTQEIRCCSSRRSGKSVRFNLKALIGYGQERTSVPPWLDSQIEEEFRILAGFIPDSRRTQCGWSYKVICRSLSLKSLDGILYFY